MDRKAYRQLDVWQRSVDLVEVIYQITKQMPADERFAMTSQLKRSATSVPANIAEGWGRASDGDYLRHLSIARGSLMELETHLIVAVRLKLLDRDDAAAAWQIMQEVGKMLTRLHQSIRKKRGQAS